MRGPEPPNPRAGVGLWELWQRWNTSWSVDLTAPMVRAACEALEAHCPSHALVLDAGAGDGHMTRVFAEGGWRAIGLDRLAENAERAHAIHPNPSFLAGDVERLPFADARFDAVYAASLMQYTRRAVALDEARRVLKPGGVLVAIENLHGSPVARAARLYLRLRGHQYRPFERPKQHLRVSDLALYSARFSRVVVRFYNLTAMLPWALTFTLPAPKRRSLNRILAPAYRALHRVDQWLVTAAPPVSGLAWHALIVAHA